MTTNSRFRRLVPVITIASSFVFMFSLVRLLCDEVMGRQNIVFAFNDGTLESVIAQFRYPEVMLRVWNDQAFFGRSNGAIPLSVTAILETLLGPIGFRRSGVLIAILLTALSSYWTLRQMKRSRKAAVITALFFLLCGWNFTFPTAGLPIRSFAMAWSLLSIGMMEKARQTTSWVLYASAGGLLGLAVSETADVGGFFAIACAAYFLFTHLPPKGTISAEILLAITGKLALYICASIFIAYQVINTLSNVVLPSATDENSMKTPEQNYEWATQWSLPKAETWSLVAGGYHGASSRSQQSPYWGGMGRSEGWETTKQGFRNFSLAGYTVGAVPIVFITFLLTAFATLRKTSFFSQHDKRVALSCAVIGVISLMLSWGKHFPLYKLLYSLPYMSSIRNPDKCLGPFTLFIGILFAYAMDTCFNMRKLKDKETSRVSRHFVKIATILPSIACLNFFYLNIAKGHFIESLNSQGYGAMSINAWNNSSHASVTALLTAVLTSVAIWSYTKTRTLSNNNAMIILSLVVSALVVFELGRSARPYVMPHSYSHLEHPNPLTQYLDSRRMDGRIKLMPPQEPLINNWRMSYLMAKGYSMFDPVSIRQMPRGLQMFFKTVAGNPLRMWQMGSIRHFICSPSLASQLMQIKSGENALFAKRLELSASQISSDSIVPVLATPSQKKYVEVLEFLPALPFFRFCPSWITLPDNEYGDKEVLARLATPDFDPSKMTYVQSGDPDAQSKGGSGQIQLLTINATRSVINTSSQHDGLIVRSTNYHPDWRAYIDGKPTTIMRSDYLFQAIKVPAGKHEIVFNFEPSIRPLFMSAASRLLLLLLTVAGIIMSTLPRKNTSQNQK